LQGERCEKFRVTVRHDPHQAHDFWLTDVCQQRIDIVATKNGKTMFSQSSVVVAKDKFSDVGSCLSAPPPPPTQLRTPWAPPGYLFTTLPIPHQPATRNGETMFSQSSVVVAKDKFSDVSPRISAPPPFFHSSVHYWLIIRSPPFIFQTTAAI